MSREAESPSAEEFRRVTIETRLGCDFVEAMEALAARMDSDDFGWVAQAIEIQRDVGGDLAGILDTVADTIRDRVRVRRQVSALSAEGRLSAVVLMVLPFGLALVMSVTIPGFPQPPVPLTHRRDAAGRRHRAAGRGRPVAIFPLVCCILAVLFIVVLRPAFVHITTLVR